jgi:hypothetical protein
MAAESGLSKSTIGRIWKEFRLKPHVADTFKLSSDPLFVAKVRDVVGLYSRPARMRFGVVRGREERHPGPGPFRTGAADDAGHARTPHA